MSALTSLLDNFSSHLRADKFVSKTFNLPASQQLDQFHKSFGQFLITGDFIDEYNNVQRGVQKSKFDFLMLNLINLLKRYVSLDEKSKSAEVKRIPLIWSNLCGVMLCRGKLQEEALETLIFSLQTSNFYPTHTPVFIYIICTVLFLIHTEVILQTKLARFEMGLYYLGYLVSKRLLVHLYLGEIDQSEAEAKLSVYLRGFPSSHLFYKNLPSIEWYHNFISSTCNQIIKYIPDSRPASLFRPSQTDLSMNALILKMFGKKKSIETDGLTWCVVQALQVWRSCRYTMMGCEVHLEALLKFCKQMKNDNWIDLVLCLDIIGEAAKENIYILVMLQMLARGSEEIKGITSWPHKVALRFVHVLADICRNTSKSSVRKQAMQGDFPIKNHPFQVAGDKSEIFKSKVSTRCYSLMSLSLLRFDRNASKEKHDLAWRLRHVSYVALLQLLKSRGDGSLSFDYMRTMCWSFLLKIKHTEDDERVFDAHSIAEMGVFYDQAVRHSVMGTNLSEESSVTEKEGERLNGYVAHLLSKRYLPSQSMVSMQDDTKRSYRRSTLKSLMSMNIIVRRPLKPRERKRLSSKGVTYMPGTAIINTHEIFGPDDDEASTSPSHMFPIGSQNNNILMYTSIQDISNKLFLLISDQIMRDTSEEWDRDIGPDKGFPEKFDESMYSSSYTPFRPNQ